MSKQEEVLEATEVNNGLYTPELENVVSVMSLKELSLLDESIQNRKKELKDKENARVKSYIIDLLSQENALGRKIYTVAEVAKLSKSSPGMVRKLQTKEDKGKNIKKVVTKSKT